MLKTEKTLKENETNQRRACWKVHKRSANRLGDGAQQGCAHLIFKALVLIYITGGKKKKEEPKRKKHSRQNFPLEHKNFV